jgi:hypothetical protein
LFEITELQLNGRGFYPGGVVHFGVVLGDSAPLAQGTDPQTLLFAVALPPSSSQDLPGWMDISVSTPPGGPGGGTSNTLHSAYLRPYNALATMGNNGYFLVPGWGVQYYDLSNGTLIKQGGGNFDPNGIAVDDRTGDVLVSSFVGEGVFNVSVMDIALNFLGEAATSDSQVVQAVAAGSGYGCVSIPGDKSISTFGPLSSLNVFSSPLPISPGTQTGNLPWPVVMTMLNGQPVCVTYDPADLTLSVLQVAASPSSNTLVGTLTIPNLLSYSQATQQSTLASWQLLAFNLPQLVVTATTQVDPALFANARITIDPTVTSINITISPSAVGSNEFSNSNQQQFTTTVSGITNTAVNWFVDGVPGGNSTVGTITSSGLFTLPTYPPETLTKVTAVSAADPSKTATAYVYYCTTPGSGGPCEIVVGISPDALSVTPGATQQFTATVGESSNTNVTWSVNGIQGGNATVGTITPTGLYTAPASAAAPGTGIVGLLSQADNVVVLINLKTMTVTGRVTLPGIPICLSVDTAHGAVIVASADLDAGLTRFYNVDVSTGALTQLTSTSNLLATGLGVSFDGTSLYACMRDQCQILPNE